MKHESNFKELNQLSLKNGTSVFEQSSLKKLLFHLVRHSGCTFCRESIAAFSKNLQRIGEKGFQPFLVHLGPEEDSELFRETFTLGDIEIISDPKKEFYLNLGARRGSVSEVLSPKVIWNGITSGALAKHGIGKPEADVFQLGGIFVVDSGQVTTLHSPKNASDQFDWSLL